jgi:hypothetical protein
MIHGVDYNETFSPVAKMVTLRIFLSLVAIYCLFTGCMDIKTAFLNASLSEDVYMEPPSNLLYLLSQLLLDPETSADQRRRILKHIKHLKRGEKLKLLKALYGTKQAGREWYLLFDSFLKEALTLKYVSLIGKRFRISYSGNLTSYLNIGITHDRVKKTVCMS